MKKLVYWGIGKIGRACIDFFQDSIPEFIIDSNSNGQKYKDIQILQPESVEEWDKLFIVVTVAADSSIRRILEGKNLIENKDFQGYKDFFDIHDETVEENIIRLKAEIHKNADLLNRTLIFAPAFHARQSEVLVKFLSKYSERKKCILVGIIMPEKKASEKIGFPFFKEAVIPYRNKKSGEDEWIEVIKLAEEELRWLGELGHRKSEIMNESFRKFLRMEYKYQEEIINLFRPKEVIIWGCWTCISSIRGHLCEKYHIPYVYMEYGCIPGTYQLDSRGFAGLSESTGLSNPETEIDYTKITEIKCYITSHKLDSSIFLADSDDEKKLRFLDHSRKTVFLVGMDDYGMGINPASAYWKEYISPVVSSTKEAYELCKEICLKYHWNFLFKPHPNPQQRNAIEDEEAGCILFQDMQVDRLIEAADVVVSIASAVNYKVLLYDKPLVQIGITGLTGKECCYEVKSKDEIEENFVMAMERGMTKQQKENFDKHLCMLLDNYLWDDLSERKLRYGQTFDKDFPFR